MARASATKQKQVEVTQDTNGDELEKRRGRKGGNPILMNKIVPDMFDNPYEVEVSNGRIISSEDFVFAKLHAIVCSNLSEFKSKQQFQDKIGGWWEWWQREKEYITDQKVEKLLEEDPQVLQKLVARYTALAGTSNGKQKEGAKS